MKLHKDGFSNKQIVETLKSKGITIRNKNNFYAVKDIWVCNNKMKKRVDREKKVKYSLVDWILNLDLRVYFKRS